MIDNDEYQKLWRTLQFQVCYYNLMDLIFILFSSIFYCIYSKSDHEIKREKKDAW